MQNQQNIKKAFLPLNQRLFHFESEDYLHSPGEVVEMDSQSIINKLLPAVGLFNDEEIQREAKVYEIRIVAILENLKPRQKEGEIDELGYERNVLPISKERQEYLMIEWDHELQSYLNFIKTIIKNSSHNPIAENIKPLQQVILQLPSDFKVPDMPRSFIPLMTRQDSALFFHYLQKLGFMPKFHDTSICVLSTPFFAVGSQSTRDDLGKIHSLKANKEIMIAFKEKIGLIIEAIDKDLSTAK